MDSPDLVYSSPEAPGTQPAAIHKHRQQVEEARIFRERHITPLARLGPRVTVRIGHMVKSATGPK